jgi:hypothetical protein
MLVLVAAGLLLVACNGGEGAPEGDGQPAESPPEAALAARDALAAELGLDPDSVSIESYEQAEWTDSCLGLGGPAESCLAAMYPGWQVMLLAGGQTYEVRTDESAEIIRINQ